MVCSLPEWRSCARTLTPGVVNNLQGFYDGNFTDLINDRESQFATGLYEDFDDTFSKNNVILVNTYGQDSVGGTYALETNSQNLPFEYPMAADDTLNFYDVIDLPVSQMNPSKRIRITSGSTCKT